jgi:hypothetical protein
MVTTLQELQVRVTLVDEATVGIDKVRAQLGLLTDSAKKGLEQLKQHNEGIAAKFKELTEAATGGERAMERYISKFGAAGLAFSGFAGIVGIGLHSLKEFAERVTDLANKAKVIGIEPAAMQNIIEQYERINVSAGVVQTSLAGLAGTLADLGRIGSEKRQEIIEAGGGAFGPQMERDLRRIESLGSIEEQLTQVITNSWNVYNQRLKQTGNELDAADLQNRYLKLFNLDPSLKLLPNIAKLTEERKKAIDARNKAAADFHKTMTSVTQELREAVNDVVASALTKDGVIVQGLEKILSLIKEFRAEWNKPWTNPAAQGNPTQPQNPAPEEPGVSPPISRLLGEDVERSKAGTSFDTPGFNKNWDWMRRSENIEDRREENFDQGGEYVRILEENTTQIKKMNENFKLLDAGQVELKGLGGIPGFGGGGGGGGGGGPYGASVGPGTGEGAGSSRLGIGGGTEQPSRIEGKASPITEGKVGPEGGGGGGSDPNQQGHPYYLKGVVSLDGKLYHYGSGGRGAGAIPYGSYPINIGKGDIGPIGQSIGSVATLGGSSGTFTGGGHHWAGVQIHRAFSDNLDYLYTKGCFSVSASEWPAFKRQLLELNARTPGGLNLNIGRDGMASITPRGQSNKELLPSYATDSDRKTLDGASSPSGVRTVDVDMSGKLTADVKAPRGADVKVEGGGAFKSTETNRTMPLDAD